MLVLSRQKSESIIITVGEIRISVMVVEIRGDKVRLGVDAPRSVDVNRDEIQAAIDRGEERPTER